ncbi:MAG: manganese-dependent inorganic pyrophosphatase [Verrucomicrobiales bacterium]|jgi:manganese-dependent inorganic pyrophosphatase
MTENAPLYVVGHKNPDTDAICSAIGHAAFLRLTTGEPAEAIRCGSIPQRTAWVLQTAGVEEPRLVTDVRLTAARICRRDVVYVTMNDTFLTAYRRMVASGVRSTPVLDDDGRIRGILRFLDLLQLLIPPHTEGDAVRHVVASLKKIVMTLQADICGTAAPEEHEEEELILLIGASSEPTIRRRLRMAEEQGNVDNYIVICGDRPNVQELAIESGVRALVVTGGFGVDLALVTKAREQGVLILRCIQDTASCVKLIQCSRMVQHALQSDFATVSEKETVSELRKRLPPAQDLFPVVDKDSHLVGVLSRSDLVDPPRPRLVLVDHNEYSQAVNGVEESDVIEVIDHHRLGGNLVSREPIRVLNEPVGSTSTLVARKFHHRDLKPEPGIALCLCAGIISDTLNLTSPTTTDVDREMLAWTSEIAGLNTEDFTRAFFAVGSLLATGTCDEILNADRKVFAEHGSSVTIAQVEEVGTENFSPRRSELIERLHCLRIEENHDLALLVVTDIQNHSSLILASGSDHLLSALPFTPLDDGSFSAQGVVSRKKQIFPAVSRALLKAALA